ncbi:Tl.2 family protein [Megaselia abdita]
MTVDCRNESIPTTFSIELDEVIRSVKIQNCIIESSIKAILDKIKLHNVTNLRFVATENQHRFDKIIFEKLYSLKELYFEQFGVIQELDIFKELQNLESLTWIALTNNVVTGDLFKSLYKLKNLTLIVKEEISETLNLTGLRNLESLKYQSNNFKDVVLEYNQLTTLDLSWNNLRDNLPDIIFQNNETLMELFLGYNNMTSFPGLRLNGFTKLQVLDVHFNLLEITEKVITEFNLPNLQFLDVSDNFFTIFPVGMFSFQKLTKLNIGRNERIYEMDGLFPEDRFENSSSLIELDMNFNNEFIPKKIFDKLVNLEKLSIEIKFHETFNSKFYIPLLTSSNGKQILITIIAEDHFQKLSKLKFLKVYVDNFFDLLEQNQILRRDFVTFYVSNESFINMENLEYLNLTNCGLKNISETLFLKQTKLLDIDLSKNMFDDTLPENIFKHSPLLLKIDLKNSFISKLGENVFAQQGQVLDINLSGNKLESLPEKIFRSTINLQNLNMQKNNFKTLSRSILAPLKKLVFLDISHNNLITFPGTLSKLIPNIRVLALYKNKLTDFDFRAWLENLQNAKMSAADIHKAFPQPIDSNLPSIKELRNLKLNLNSNLLSLFNFSEIEGTFKFKSYRKPTTLELSDNNFDCYCEMIDFKRFLLNNSFENMSFLKINKEDISCKSPETKLLTNYSDKDFISILNISDCPKECNCYRQCLEELQVTNCSARELTETPTIPALIESHYSMELLLQFNRISNLSFGYEDHVTRIIASNNHLSAIESLPRNLKMLDIQYNKFSKMDSQVLQQFQDQQIQTYLSGNDFLCDCQEQDFRLIKFLNEFPDLVIDNGLVSCLFDGLVYSIYSEILLCKFSFMPYVIGGLVILLVSVITISLFLIYKLEIKVWLYAHNLFLWWVTEEDLDKDKKYDAFICYSEKDQDYVTQIVDTLESGPHPYKLCLHFRDWKAGEYIPNQIVSSIGESRRIIFILTPNFVRSFWSRLEFRTAHSASLNEKRARVIVILCGEIESLGELDAELKAYIKSNTYLKWGDRWFWDRLIYALPHYSIKVVRSEEIELQTT